MDRSIDDILDDEMGDMADMGLELDLDEDALLADDYDEKSTTQSRFADSKLVEDEDFIEIGIEDDMSDDMKNEMSETTKKAHSTIAFDERNDSDEGNRERSRFKTERNIVGPPRTTNAIPETLDAVPVKNNYQPNQQNQQQRGKNRNFRGGARGRHRGGMAPLQHQGQFNHFQPPQPPPHFPSGNIHVNPHFRSNFNFSGGWNGWNQEQPRNMPHQNFQEPHFGNQRWNENAHVDYQYQQPYQEPDNYYNGNEQFYQPNYAPPQMPQAQGGWDQPFYPPHQNDFGQPQYPPEQPFRNNFPNSFPPQNFQQPPQHMQHPGMMQQQRFPGPKKFGRSPIQRGGMVKPPPMHGVKNKPPMRENYHQNKGAMKPQRTDALRLVTISNLHEVKMVESHPNKVQKIEPEEEDEEMRAYRLKIEEQKKLREALLKQKEEKRKVAAQQKTQQLEAGVSSAESSKDESPSESEDFKVVRVRTPDGKTVLKKLTLAQIAKLKKVTPTNKAENGDGAKPEAISKIVAIDNLSASTTRKQLEIMAKQVGPIESLSHDADLKKAIIRFKSEESAVSFENRNQRKMVDLSMITVRLVQMD